MSDNYTELVKELYSAARDQYLLNGYETREAVLLEKASDAIVELQASVIGYEMNTDMAFVKEDGRTVIRFIPKVQCPHYRPNHHDRGDDSLCEKYHCEVKALPRWVPVTERLPEEKDSGFSDDVLILVKEQDGDFIWEDVYSGYYLYDAVSDETGWWAQMPQNCQQIKERFSVTHWMPLPPPQKGTQDED